MGLFYVLARLWFVWLACCHPSFEGIGQPSLLYCERSLSSPGQNWTANLKPLLQNEPAWNKTDSYTTLRVVVVVIVAARDFVEAFWPKAL